MKCQACKQQKATWAWQPFGPNETPDSFSLVGSHYRGFPVIKVCDSCKGAFQTGDFIVSFSYKGHHFVAKDHQIKEVKIDLYDGGTTTIDAANGSATMIMKSTIGGSELAALVPIEMSELLPVFMAAPNLVEACDELDALQPKITQYLDFSYVEKVDRDAILMALAKMKVELRRAHGE